MNDTSPRSSGSEVLNLPSVQWIKNGNPPDGWYGTVYGRVKVWGEWGELRVFHGVDYFNLVGWRFQISRNKGNSGGFASWDSITENCPIEVKAWLAVDDKDT